MSRLEIRLLGQFEISQANTLSQLQLTSACQRLFAYLLLNTGKLCRREVLMEVFWRENTPERARSCLNSAVFRLRRELEASGLKSANYLLTMETGEIGFNWECDYWLDVQIFEQQLSPILRKPVSDMEAEEVAQIERLLALYRGELLDGIYDDWLLIERERLRLMYLNALTQLMNYYAHGGALEKGMGFARTILKEDPLREDIHRILMRLYLADGQRPLAVQQYRTCVAILDRELGVPPMAETDQLYQQIVNPSAQLTLATNMLSIHPEMEQHLQTAVHNLEQAHSHLIEAANLMARLMYVNKSYGDHSFVK